jgi:tetratricopeptide (TPR) repeat protein
MNQTVKEDPVRTHRDGTAFFDSGNYKQAVERFLRASKLYENVGDFFDVCYTLFRAAECSFFLKDYETAAERFLEAADMAFDRGFDRFGLGALEYAKDSCKASGETKGRNVSSIDQRITEAKEKLSKTF